MKNIGLILLLYFVGFVAFAQTFQIEWQQCFGGSKSDQAYDVIDIDNGYLIVGATKSNDGDVILNHGAVDAWIVRINDYGDFNWQKCFGGSNSEYFARVFQDNQRKIYLLGDADSSDGDISYDPYPGSTDFWIVKIDSSGNILWDRILGGNILDQMWTGTLTYDGGVVALGWSGSPDGDVTEHFGGYDMWMVKLNSDGIKEWDFSIGTDGFDYGQAIIQTSDSGFLVGGTATIGEGGNLICDPFNYNAEAILVKLDINRNIEWQQCYGGSGHDGIIALLELENGYIFSAYGSSGDGDLTGSGWHGESDVWVVRTDFEGNIIWQKCYGGSNYELAGNIYQLDDDGFILMGNTKSQNGDVVGNHSMDEFNHDIWVIKINQSGELLWQQCIGGAGNEVIFRGVRKLNDYSFIIAGETNFGPSFDVECTPYGGLFDRDFWVLEISDTTVSVEEVDEQVIKVYPNPAVNYVVFEVPPPLVPPEGRKNPILRIHNVFGQEVAQIPLKSEITVWDTRRIKNGIYFYQIYMDCTIKSGKIIISK